MHDTNIAVRWSQLLSPRGEVREGFWIMMGDSPVVEAPFSTKQDAMNYMDEHCSCVWEDGDDPNCVIHLRHVN